MLWLILPPRASIAAPKKQVYLNVKNMVCKYATPKLIFSVLFVLNLFDGELVDIWQLHEMPR